MKVLIPHTFSDPTTLSGKSLFCYRLGRALQNKEVDVYSDVGAEVDIAFVMPTLSLHSVVSLLSNAGVIVGIGDFRQEKGRGSYGTFSVTGEDSGELSDLWEEITQEGRDVQEAAMNAATPYDEETEDLMEFLEGERNLRVVA